MSLTSSIFLLYSIQMGLFDGLKKMVGVVDQGEALVQDNDKVRTRNDLLIKNDSVRFSVTLALSYLFYEVE